MKKYVFLLLTMCLLLTVVTFAEASGIQLIQTGAAAGSVETLDDIAVSGSYVIDDYARIRPQSFSFVDGYTQYQKDQARKDGKTTAVNSGVYADYAYLLVDFVNLKKVPVDFTADAHVAVVYNEDYVFSGWVRQLNYDISNSVLLDPMNIAPIDMLHGGHYIFGCKLPTAVIEGTEPLKMVINLGKHELTYYIRH